ncbi:unnamed protein product, partial [Prorocentrum cordatum]
MPERVRLPACDPVSRRVLKVPHAIVPSEESGQRYAHVSSVFHHGEGYHLGHNAACCRAEDGVGAQWEMRDDGAARGCVENRTGSSVHALMQFYPRGSVGRGGRGAQASRAAADVGSGGKAKSGGAPAVRILPGDLLAPVRELSATPIFDGVGWRRVVEAHAVKCMELLLVGAARRAELDDMGVVVGPGHGHGAGVSHAGSLLQVLRFVTRRCGRAGASLSRDVAVRVCARFDGHIGAEAGADPMVDERAAALLQLHRATSAEITSASHQPGAEAGAGSAAKGAAGDAGNLRTGREEGGANAGSGAAASSSEPRRTEGVMEVDAGADATERSGAAHVASGASEDPRAARGENVMRIAKQLIDEPTADEAQKSAQYALAYNEEIAWKVSVQGRAGDGVRLRDRPAEFDDKPAASPEEVAAAPWSAPLAPRARPGAPSPAGPRHLEVRPQRPRPQVLPELLRRVRPRAPEEAALRIRSPPTTRSPPTSPGGAATRTRSPPTARKAAPCVHRPRRTLAAQRPAEAQQSPPRRRPVPARPRPPPR